VLDELAERQAVHRPLDVPGFEAGELEDLVEQGAEPVDVAQDLLGVGRLERSTAARSTGHDGRG
jgi:hypothetical protein